MPKFFRFPWAYQGDKSPIPDAVQADGSFSYNQGFGFDYERARNDPSYKPVPREGMNGVFHDITEALGTIQRQGVFDWVDAAQNGGEAVRYELNALVRHQQKVWRSRISDNRSEPGTDGTWTDLSISHNCARFTESGRLIIPADVTTIWISGCAGGGGGAGGSGNHIQGAAAPSPGGGGAGEFVIAEPHDVVPGQVLDILIGTRGLGGERGVPMVTEPGNGIDGGDTVIGSVLTLRGGKGGGRGISAPNGAYSGGKGGAGFPNGGSGTDGTSSIERASHTGLSGAGASGPFGGGGLGQRSGIPQAQLNEGLEGMSAAGFGTGGGGGGSSYINVGAGGKGGNGAPGFVMIRW
ncbi:hypothetical protein NRB16_24415 [Pseudomonas sp. LJDD11]|uniref:glycine-rich domain-containing protein n=1 Tax=unclassified Pseudomonas TaxID=196821 RepID=UPI0020968E20|nr:MULTISPECIES: hypothetical protein [unclassified Pseudomonas]MCO8160988.1 hypothetical protein [Pseudomonas sp. 21LCFQ010]MCQ9426668.1 hypothetical protein [Pseudomonas sp. LJDD11]